jgi:hypothetical protein
MNRLKAKPPPSTNGSNGHAHGPAGGHAPGPAPAAPEEGRDAKGRFAKCWRGGPGGAANPFARRVAELRRVLVEAVGDRGMTRLVEALLKQAEAGDLAAAQLLLDYTVGKPITDNPHPDHLDADEYHTLASAPDTQRLAAGGNRHVPWGFALAVLRATHRVMRCFMMAHPPEHTGCLLGTLDWERVLEELNDPELTQWYEQIRREANPP